MGGGDLNSKKSWHPNTIKNQERVWKAEKAAAEEKRRIAELQRERAEERDRTELNELAKRSADDDAADGRLHWMYEKPDKSKQQEDYLLGKAVDKNYDQPEHQESEIPAVARRVVGSSMLATGGDVQVDLARKLREDPLLLVKERERAARAALLNNPLHRHRLTELLRKEQEQKKESKSKKKEKKNLDKMLADKLSALGGDKGVDLSALLASDSDSSSYSSADEKPKKKKKKKQSKTKKKSKKSKHERSKSDVDSDSGADHKLKNKDNKYDKQNKVVSHEKDISYRTESLSKKYISSNKEPQKRKSDGSDNDVDSKRSKKESIRTKSKVNRDDRSKCYGSFDKKGRQRSRSPDNKHDKKRGQARDSKLERGGGSKLHRYDSSERRTEGRTVSERYCKGKGSADDGRRQNSGISEEERAAKLAAMAAAGAERESMRARRVAQQRAAAAESAPHAPRRAPALAAALPDSLEARIHSNRHYIQRNNKHMNEHFARR